MTSNSADPKLSHVGPGGEARMVDVSGKEVTVREAVASAAIRMKPTVLERVMGGSLPKGEVLGTARIAGVQAAKRTSEWIPMCHSIPLDWVEIRFTVVDRGGLRITCTAKTSARTGVEMEALTGAAAAALTVYDMAKGADKTMVIGPIQLESKSGGKSGTFRR